MKPGDLVRLDAYYPSPLDEHAFVIRGLEFDTNTPLLLLGTEVWSNPARPKAKLLHPAGKICYVSLEYIVPA